MHITLQLSSARDCGGIASHDGQVFHRIHRFGTQNNEAARLPYRDGTQVFTLRKERSQQQQFAHETWSVQGAGVSQCLAAAGHAL